MGSTASAATASISTVGTWVYPGRLVVTTSGAPAAPYNEGDATGLNGHGVQWLVLALAPTHPCPTTADAMNNYHSWDASWIAYGAPTGPSFKETDTAYNAAYQDDTKPWHLCGLLVESGSNMPKTVTATSDTAVPPRVRNYGVRVNGNGNMSANTPYMGAIGQCQDFWPNGKYQYTTGCPLAGKVVATVSTKVQHQAGLAGTLLGHATLVAYTGTVYRTGMTLTKAGKKAVRMAGSSRWNNWPVRIKATVTSPIQMTQSRSIRGPEFEWVFDSWETNTSNNIGG
jgi:hypothetical protein